MKQCIWGPDVYLYLSVCTFIYVWCFPNACHFTFCFLENNLTPLFLFTCTDHHLKCIQVVLPSQAVFGENDPTMIYTYVYFHWRLMELNEHITHKM